eukprot:TRINITY_DN4199_c0_g1_i3.p1 TRINITY_DN4199_c0_g1~~TRINITY_DN4199_c0_g1_i3.p1  ORF type:complete len:250 (+),score=32.52 TRINITY_DN4199_c0_g1_i3:143-892(+)
METHIMIKYTRMYCLFLMVISTILCIYTIDIECDTWYNILTIRESYNHVNGALLSPVVFKSQLYYFDERTIVDRDLNVLKRKKKIRVFNSPKMIVSSILVMDDYLYIMDQLKDTLEMPEEDLSIIDTFKDFIGDYRNYHIRKTSLKKKLKCSDKEITILVQAGIIISEGPYLWFRIPNLGKVTQICKKAKASLLRIIRKKRFQEIMQMELEAKNIPSSPFDTLFHIRDLIGRDVLGKKDTTSGVVIFLK